MSQDKTFSKKPALLKGFPVWSLEGIETKASASYMSYNLPNDESNQILKTKY